MSENFVNTQILDAVDAANETVMGHAAAGSAGMLDALMASTVGMAMYNAVNTQHNSQMVSSAAIAASCAKMLKVAPVPWIPPALPVGNPAVLKVTAVTATPNQYTVAGAGFAEGLTAEISQNGSLIASLSGTAITGVSATSFTMQTDTLPAGTYLLQVFNPGGGKSLPYSFTVSGAQADSDPSGQPTA